MKIKSHFKSQFERAKSELSLPEYIIWWIIRGLMLFAMISKMKENRDSMVWVMIGANLAVTFVIPLLAVLLPRKLFFGRLPFRVQTYVDIFVIAGSFVGHYLNLYRFEGVYDKCLHIVSGFVAVFIGYEIMKALSPEKKLPKKWGAFGGFTFSFMVMVLWELFEFFSDFILDSNNQGFSPRFCQQVYRGETTYFFFKIFGNGNPGLEDTQLPVLDTNIDILAAVVGSFIALFLILIFVKDKKEEKAVKPVESADTEKEEAVL